MFRSERQQCLAIRVLLRPIFRDRLDGLWTGVGPTSVAVKYLDGNPLSSGEDIMLRAAFDVWNGAGKITLWRIMGSLDQNHEERLFSLMIAIGKGAGAIDDWIEEYVGKTEVHA